MLGDDNDGMEFDLKNNRGKESPRRISALPYELANLDDSDSDSCSSEDESDSDSSSSSSSSEDEDEAEENPNEAVPSSTEEAVQSNLATDDLEQRREDTGYESDSNDLTRVTSTTFRK